MERADITTLRALGFADDELKTLGLWEPASGEPVTLAEAYIRRSQKRDDVTTLRKHVRDVCRAAAFDGVRIRHVWFEQKSASKAHVRREEFDKATRAVLDGLSKTLYVWKTDRLSRRGMGQVGLLLDDFDKRSGRVVSVTEGLDSSKGSRMVFAILSERAREEAKDIAMRVKAGKDAHRAEGRWTGGVTPYGVYSPKGSGRLAPHPTEYLVSRRIADSLLAGFTPATIAAMLVSEGARTRTGKNWTATGIISLAHSPAWAGLLPDRERMTDEFGAPLDKWHRACSPLMGPDGHPVSAGEGVVAFAEWSKIQALLASRAVEGSDFGNRARGKRRPVTLLSALLRCPHCKGPMQNAGVSYYCLARKQSGPTACRGITTERQRVDFAVYVLWLNHIMSLPPESETIHEIARRWLSYQDPEKEARKAAVSAALDKAVSRELRLQKEFFIGGSVDETTYEVLRRELSAQIDGMKRELAELQREADLSPLMDAESLAALWGTAGVEGQRALLAAALRSITLTPARFRGDRTPIEERLIPDWRDEEGRASWPEVALDAVKRSRLRRKERVALQGT
ncbi:recombinase family protein [Kitasatospora sp. GP82]|uniref:recombinase family protein n=1 Tax=Kitasatospora sp. GP82 TaxID=3035089 RepID=UPI002473CB9C|nr:recombinase family protein [Kitasatospora sp. GP82]MDH6129005.1 site-specific DNA recombinase [Kitasatospora sp. GP82]